jgi:DNA-binding beta-propeller fold protein YncE
MNTNKNRLIVNTRDRETAAKARYTRFHSTPQQRPAARGAAGSGWLCPISGSLRPIFGSVCLAAFCLLAVTSPLAAQTAHSGATVLIGSGFSYPAGVAVDRSGNVFVADTQNNAVKEIVAVNGVVSSSSTVNTINSGFSHPRGVAVDGSGNVFVADTQNKAVKEIVAVNGVVSSSSTVNTINSGFNTPPGVAVDRSGNVFVPDYGNSAVYEIVAINGVVSSSSTVNTIGSGFNAPPGVAVDRSGNVFVADEFNNAVKEIVAVNGVVSSSSTVNTIGSGFIGPTGVAVDGSGNVFVADTNNNAVYEIVAVNGVVSPSSTVITIASGFYNPFGVSVDGSGDVFVADTNNNTVKEIVAGAQKFPTTPVGSTSAALTIYFTFDTGGSLAATPYLVLTQGAQNLDFKAAATQASDACVTGHAYNAGDVCTVNVTFTPAKPYQRIGAVQLMGSAGTPIATFNLRGTGTGPQVIFPSNSTANTIGSGFDGPYGVAVDGSGNVFVADTFNNAVKEIVAVNGVVSSSSTVNPIGNGFSHPTGVAVDGSGNVFVTDAANNAVKEIVALNGVVSSSSTVNTVGSGFSGPIGVAVDGSGNVFVADTYNNAVKEILALNGVVSSSSTVNTVGSGFSYPHGVAVDGSGNVFVADSDNNEVKEIVAVNGVVSSSSTVNTIGSGFSFPEGVAVDGSGNVFVGDYGNSAVKEIVAVNGVASSNSMVNTIGSGFLNPLGVAVDGSGNVFVGDFNHSAVKEIDRSDPPTLSFASTPVGSTSSDSPQSVLFQNSGNQQLTAMPPGLTIIGANFAQVPGTGTPEDCSATFSLAPGASCNLSISFTPTASGPLSSTASLTDNALNGNPATQSISLQGTGLQQSQTITFGAIANQVVGTQLGLTASASSGLAVSFSSLTPSVCTVSGATATMVLARTCSIQATQAGNATYTAAQPVTQSFLVTDFSLNVTPSSQTIPAGHMATYSVALASVNGFSGNVALNCSGGPPHSTCSVSPTSVALSNTSTAKVTLMLNTPMNVNLGTFKLTLTAKSGSDVHTQTVSLTVK